MFVSSVLYVQIENILFCPIVFLKTLHENGWSFDDYGLKSYLPKHDGGAFFWVQDDISIDEIFNILDEKKSLRELLGVVLTWGGSNIGGEFLLDFDGNIVVNLNINRCLLLNGMTDVNWYFDKIIPFVKKAGMNVTRIKFEENF